MERNYVIGIDFGTSNSVVAVNVDDEVQVIQNDVMKRTTPSCLHFYHSDEQDDDIWLVDREDGESAARMTLVDPDNSIKNVKQLLGKNVWDIRDDILLKCTAIQEDGENIVLRLKNGMTFLPEQAAGIILLTLKSNAERQLDHSVTKAVLTVPGYFNEQQRGAVLNAALRAGLKLVTIIDESFAAAITYAEKHGQQKKLLVIDVGGGGGCIAGFDSQQNKVAMLYTTRYRLPGGIDFDEAMIQWLLKQIEFRIGKAYENPQHLAMLNFRWEEAKSKLSRVSLCTISVPYEDNYIEIEVRREDLEETCAHIFSTYSREVELMLSEGQFGVVDVIVMVGGSSRIPRLQKVIQDALPNATMCKTVHPDEGVAVGAARFGSGKVKLYRIGEHSETIDSANTPSKRTREETTDDSNTSKKKKLCPNQSEAKDAGTPNNANETDDKPSKVRTRLNFSHVRDYRLTKRYPAGIKSKNAKSNFRKQCKPFGILNGKLWYKKIDDPDPTLPSPFDDEKLSSLSNAALLEKGFRIAPLEAKRKQIIEIIHKNVDTSVQSRALGAHNGRDKSIADLQKRYYWSGMKEDLRDFIKSCTICEQENTSFLKIVPKLRPVGVPSKVMAQIGVDLMTLPCVNGYNYVYVAIDYFSKWVEARPGEHKDAKSVALFIYEEIICRHGCPAVQINDQGREFVNSIDVELRRLSGTQQRVTSPYHPQANGMVERQNRTIKSRLVKVLGSIEEWPAALPGVLFACRTAMHRATTYSPFYLMYLRQPVLPLDVREIERNEFDVDEYLKLTDKGAEENEDPMDMAHFNTVLESMLSIRTQVHDKAGENIKKMQKRYKKDYDSRHNTDFKYSVGDHVFLKDPKHLQRQGKGRSLSKKSGTYTITEIVDDSRVMLKNDKTGQILKSTYNMEHISLCKTIKNENPDSDPDDIVPDKDQSQRPAKEEKAKDKKPTEISDSEEDIPPQRPKKNYSYENIGEIMKLSDAEIIVNFQGSIITAKEIKLLNSCEWLNDKIINFYCTLVAKDMTKSGTPVFAFSSFFYKKLFSKGVDQVLHERKAVNMCSQRFLLIPVHAVKHWFLCVVDFKEKSILIYDSMEEERVDCLNKVTEYVRKRWKEESKKCSPPLLPFDMTSWRMGNAERVAQQPNFFDCGVYLCHFAKRACRELPCSDRPTEPRAMLMQEILQCSLLPETPNKGTKSEGDKSEGSDFMAVQSGIRNVGNTCFLSAALQLLFHCEPFMAVLRTGNSLRLPSMIISKYLNTAYDLYCQNSVYDPTNLMRSLKALLPNYKEGDRYDAEELINFLLLNVGNEIEESLEIFRSLLHTNVKCTACKAESGSDETPVMLSLNINKCRSVQDCINMFFAPETVTSFKCEGCKELVEVSKTTELKSAPRVLLLHLKRFEHTGSKIEDIIRQNLQIKVGEKSSFHFLGSINHITRSSHYEAIIKIGKKFVRFNDAQVTVSSIGELTKEQSYVLCYVKQTASTSVMAP